MYFLEVAETYTYRKGKAILDRDENNTQECT